MYKKELRSLYGFTLIELLIVIGILAGLAALTFVALDPLARFQDSRNAQRWTDSKALLDAIMLDQVDNGGVYHDNITAMSDNTYYQIGTLSTGCNTPSCGNPSVTLQTAWLSPPVALSAYFLKGVVPNWELKDIYIGMMQFMVLQVVGLLLIVIFPAIATWLPALLNR